MTLRTRQLRPGFTLLEVLIAVGILGLALIGVAAVFPVGATWTRQAIEDTVGQNVALNAVDIIRAKCTEADMPNSLVLTGLPGIGNGHITLTDRVYGFGTAQPYPMVPDYAPRPYNAGEIAAYHGGFFVCTANGTGTAPTLNGALQGGWAQSPTDPRQNAQYSWTAVGRRISAQQHDYAVYILVFRRGDTGQSYATGSAVADTRYTGPELADPAWCPIAIPATYASGALVNETVTGAVPPVGDYGVTSTGAVFQQGLNSTATAGDTRVVMPVGANNIVIGAAPTGWPNSSLVYVYQTVLSY